MNQTASQDAPQSLIKGGKTGKTPLSAIPLDLPAVAPIQIARNKYFQWKSKVPFLVDLQDYLEHGIVVSRPDIFGMVCVIYDPEPVLFVRMVVGDLRTLLFYLPVLTRRIRFHRRNEDRVREYDLAKLLQTTGKLMKRKP